MLALADIMRAAGPHYQEVHADRVLPSHHRAMRDIVACRTAARGGSLDQCDACAALDCSSHSCRNRHCPTCQEERAQDWLARTRARLLPCNHYLLTFTLPQALRAVARSHQQVVYAALLREAAAALQTLADDRTWVGGTLGILAVLHTWSRTLEDHPHAHLLVTAGGFSSDGTAWITPAYPRFLVPGYMLSEIFRAKIHDLLAKAGLDRDLDPTVWTRRWTVHIQQSGPGDHATRYLARDVYRVALSNHALERFEHGRVTFRSRHARPHETRRLTLPAEVLLGRFLQHVLPRGFTKIRSYGLLSPSRRRDLDAARRLLQRQAGDCAPTAGITATTTLGERTARPDDRAAVPRCPVCACGHLRLVERVPRSRAPP